MNSLSQIASDRTATAQLDQRVVLFSEDHGIYLGNALGLAFWSKLDAAGQIAAVTFQSEAVAREHVATWSDQPGALQFVPVKADAAGYASIEACVAAGLPAWSPEDPEPVADRTDAPRS